MKIGKISNELLHLPLPSPVGGSGISAVDVLITRLWLDSGTMGLGFSYVLGGSGQPALCCAELLASTIANTRLHHPSVTWRTMDSTLNRTGKGPNNIAIAAIDLACWDAYARDRDQILGIALGGAPREIPVYGSGLYNASLTPAQAIEVTKVQLQAGFRGVKPRVDATRSGIEILRAVRDVVPLGVELMCDVNEKGTASRAQRLMSAARDCGYLFVEEPMPADDLAGYRSLAHEFPRFAAAGEHLQGVKQALPFLAEGICGVIQPDLAMIGGLTPALELTRVANAYGVEVSPHFLPGLFVHLGYACPNVTWLEDFPLLEPLFNGWPTMVAGKMTAVEAPGHGLSLAEGVLQQFKWCNDM
ncbi:mandelate racemase/muconate lactonizing enzyme family protein [Burkholderia multivorans]|uniref:mandelate racemase/muconate lactonizing enzyme family protein n=1 Tax=Burkholderia multivorans TaxID=87883 RepID=UPI00143E66B2|nr:mandelate racemase/muconate lactonizing enzyme family protein [Burkholderia multivorans]MBU9468915.1 mandelate racemase/muconate lactonizing enzyme family protein [Burkholderia multivorans]MCA8129956.1 mandelate racemase/muconate lactonizing enzyme family protein [Burkholderia multivorans]QIX19166.1 mandelate racemase/muconate lactonizing enzyme family protein [Burkholderia multivorans]